MDKHVLKLGPARYAFYDPESRLNLTLSRPQGEIPADRPVSGSIIGALLSGGLIDVNGTINFRPSTSSPPTPVAEVPPVATPVEVEATEEVTATTEEPTSKKSKQKQSK